MRTPEEVVDSCRALANKSDDVYWLLDVIRNRDWEHDRALRLERARADRLAEECRWWRKTEKATEHQLFDAMAAVDSNGDLK